MLAQDTSIRLLQYTDVDQAMGLTCAAGWNQLPADWHRLLSLEPEGCFVLEANGKIASSTTAICYGKELAWIGMVLTAPEFRRRGFAEQLMERALRFVDSRGVATVRLDATESGIHLYRKLGFADECEIQRWRRPPGPVPHSDGLTYHPNAEYDWERFGADRQALLARLATQGAASLPSKSYAMGRNGFSSAYFGPCVAGSPDDVRILLRWFLSSHPQESVLWDLFPENKDAVAIAEEFGFVPARRLVRMRRSRTYSSIAASHPDIFAIAGFELG